MVEAERVILYVVPNCPLCEEARIWLHALDVSFEEHDVANSHSALRQMYRLTRQGSVPVVAFRGKALVRPSKEELKELITS